MKTPFINIILFTACVCAVILTGCSKSSARAQALDPSKVPGVVSQAFDKASDQTKQEAADCVNALNKQDTTAAFIELQRMRAKGDLTPEQREAVSKAMQTTFKQVQSLAQNGNSAAQAAVHQYLSSR